MADTAGLCELGSQARSAAGATGAAWSDWNSLCRPPAAAAASVDDLVPKADGPAIQQSLQGDRLVALASGEYGNDRLAASFRSPVQLGREPALGAAQSLVRRLTPLMAPVRRAPAAC
jgi:hypothetical protein